MRQPDEAEFESFLNQVEPGLRRALFSVLGVDRGREATAAEALAWAWEHWRRVKRMDNPTVPIPGGSKSKPGPYDDTSVCEIRMERATKEV